MRACVFGGWGWQAKEAERKEPERKQSQGLLGKVAGLLRSVAPPVTPPSSSPCWSVGIKMCQVYCTHLMSYLRKKITIIPHKAGRFNMFHSVAKLQENLHM